MKRLFIAASAILLCADYAAAQSPTAPSPFLPIDHWSYRLLRRLDTAGLLPPGSDIGRRSMPQEEIALLLEQAANGDTLSAVAAYHRRLREELAAAHEDDLTRLDASVVGAYHATNDQVAAGVGYDTAWSGALPLEDEHEADALARAAWALKPVALAVATDRDGLEEMQLVVAAGAAGFWAGRRELGFAVGNGGIVLDRHRLDGGGFFLTHPARLPLLGHTRFEVHLAKVDNVLNLAAERRDLEPWFLAARGSLQPHPRLTIGVSRGMMFGGEGNLPVTGKRVARMLAGFSNTDDENSFANQVVSIDFRWRLPAGAVPLAVYLEWGTEDLSGGWWDVPGIVAGIEWSALPARDLSFGIERTEFKRNTGSNSHWYQNAWFQGSWTDAGAILGHSLGGHGIEWRVFAGGGTAETLTTQLAAYRRHRRAHNVFAPERGGVSAGATVEADARLSRNLRLLVTGELERGSTADWTTGRGRAGFRLLF